MVITSNNKIVYDSWKDGSDIYKDKKGYYIIQWNPKIEKTYKKYLPKSWKPNASNTKSKSKSKKSKKKTNKTKRKTKTKTQSAFWKVLNL